MLTFALSILQPRLVVSVIVACLIAAGCDRSPRSSGIPIALNKDAILRSVGAQQGITIELQTSGAGQGASTSESNRQLTVKVATGTPGQLFAAYRAEVRKQIQQRGGVINGEPRVGSDQDIRDFHFDYTWQGNQGLVRVRTVALANGSSDFSQFCYEHRR